jgi:fatty acid desaturase
MASARSSGGATGIEDMTVGAPRSAREALQAGAIGLDALRAAHRLRDSRSALDVLITVVSFVAIPAVFGLFPTWWSASLLALFAIRTFNCAAQLVHESDHGTLFRDPRLNRMFGNLFAYLLGYTRSGHRTAHMDHHVYLNTERDPDIIFSQPGAGASAIARGLLGDLFFVSALKRLLQYSQSDRASYSVSPWRRLTLRHLAQAVASMAPVAASQLVLLALFTVTGGRWAYLLLHVLPIMTLYPLQIRVRSIAEHGFEAGYEPSSAADAWTTRTSRLNFLERWIVAPFGQYLHYEHHVFPGVPNYNLGEVHRLLVASGIPMPTNRSYFGFVISRIRADWARGSDHGARAAIPPRSEA